MSGEKKLFKFLVPVICVAVLGLVVVLLVKFFASMEQQPEQKKVVQQVTLIQPPPPPPPPPEDEPEPPPEPDVEEVIEELEEALPEEMDSEPPAGNDLGVDAEGGAGGDSFGLVGRKGGRGVIGGGYASVVQQEITEFLSESQELRRHEYVFIVKLWFDREGRIDRYKVSQKKGGTQVQELIEVALRQLGKISEPPPLELPQPITLRIRSQF